MVDSCSSLWLKELGEVWISLLDLTHAPSIASLLLPLRLAVTLVCKSSLASFCLFDILKVTVAIKCENTEHKSKVPITSVVESVWLVPVWEFAHVLMSHWCLITWLEVTRDPIPRTISLTFPELTRPRSLGCC